MAEYMIEIYRVGCATCKETIEMVKKSAGADHEVKVHEMRHGDTAVRAKKLGIRSLPAVVVNGNSPVAAPVGARRARFCPRRYVNRTVPGKRRRWFEE